MAKISSALFKVLLVGGVNLLGTKPKSITDKITNEIKEGTHGLGDDWAERSAVGRMKGELSQSGAFFDTAQAAVHNAFKAAQSVAREVVYAMQGNTLGAPFVGYQGTYVGSYDVISQSGDLVEANAAYAVSGKVERGMIAQPWETKTGDWTGDSIDYVDDPTNLSVPITSNSQAADSVITTPVPHKLVTGDVILIAGVATSSPTINGERTVTVVSDTTFTVGVDTSAGAAGTGGTFKRCSSHNGASGYQAVSDLSGFTGFVGKLQHSDDDSSYSDLITFSNVTAASASERKTVTGTVHRYIRFVGDVTGSGSIKPFAGISRNAP